MTIFHVSAVLPFVDLTDAEVSMQIDRHSRHHFEESVLGFVGWKIFYKFQLELEREEYPFD